MLVTGAGPIGLLAMQCARAFGATEVTISDVNPHRLALAGRTGATRTARRPTTSSTASDRRADRVLGPPGALTAGIKALRPAGTAVLVGMGPGEEGTLPLSVIQGARDLGDRHLPLREHVPDRDRARRRAVAST